MTTATLGDFIDRAWREHETASFDTLAVVLAA
jgi:hypothetical protein